MHAMGMLAGFPLSDSAVVQSPSPFDWDSAIRVSTCEMDEERQSRSEGWTVSESASTQSRLKKAPKPGAYPHHFSPFVMTAQQVSVSEW